MLRFQNTTSLLDTALPDLPVANRQDCLSELSVYLIESFGNSTRIDYGTGHEMNFVMFCAALFRVGALDVEDQTCLAAVGLTLFNIYMNLVRQLQQVTHMYTTYTFLLSTSSFI